MGTLSKNHKSNLDFRFVLAELRALSEVVGIPAYHFSEKFEADAHRRFRFDFEENEIITEKKLKELCDRSISIHGLYEIWEEGKNYDELRAKLKFKGYLNSL